MTGYQNFLAAMIAVLQIAMVSLICDDGDVMSWNYAKLAEV